MLDKYKKHSPCLVAYLFRPTRGKAHLVSLKPELAAQGEKGHAICGCDSFGHGGRIESTSGELIEIQTLINDVGAPEYGVCRRCLKLVRQYPYIYKLPEKAYPVRSES